MASKEDTLPDLTTKQMNYVLARQSGKGSTDAYRQAYDCSNMNQASIWRRACEVGQHSKVKAWLSVIKTQQISVANYTLEAHLADMANIKELALAKGNISAATKACENLGKACNHYTTHTETTVTHKADIELLDNIEREFGQEARTKAEKRLGLH